MIKSKEIIWRFMTKSKGIILYFLTKSKEIIKSCTAPQKVDTEKIDPRTFSSGVNSIVWP